MSDFSDYSSLQQPSGGYGSTAGPGGYGTGQGSTTPYGDAPVRVADASVSKPAKEARTLNSKWKLVKDGPKKPTDHIYILFYFSTISEHYSLNDFLNYLHGTKDPNRWGETSPFIGVADIVTRTDPATVWSDLGNALNEPGAVVIYWGHSERAKSSNKARNLRPRPDPYDSSNDIPMTALTKLLAVSNAKAFLVAACATDGCIGKIKRDTAIIATDSGKDLVTNSLNWANALGKFLLKFIKGATIADCITEANAAFAAGKSDADDSFVLASGLGSMTFK